MDSRQRDIIHRLQTVTKGCRPDMHEPDEQGVTAHVVGSVLDNSCGNRISTDLLKDGCQDFIVFIRQSDPNGSTRIEGFSLADLIAIVRNTEV